MISQVQLLAIPRSTLKVYNIWYIGSLIIDHPAGKLVLTSFANSHNGKHLTHCIGKHFSAP